MAVADFKEKLKSLTSIKFVVSQSIVAKWVERPNRGSYG